MLRQSINANMNQDLKLMTRKPKKIDIAKMFDDEQEDFLDSLNEKLRDGMPAERMKVLKFDEISTQYGNSLRIELEDLDNDIQYSFLCSGKVFRKLFEENVKSGDIIKIYSNEKSHWRFEFTE
jgi:hypothetical protein